jgi:integrase/recombinase XerD
MNKNSLLHVLRPWSHGRYQQLPLFGSIMEELCCGLRGQGYTVGTLRKTIAAIAHLDQWLRRHGALALSDLTQEDLRRAWVRCLGRKGARLRATGGVGLLARFLSRRGLIAAGPPRASSPLDAEIAAYSSHMREDRGLSETTVYDHQRRLRPFLIFIGLGRRRSPIRDLGLNHIDRFLRLASRTNDRASMRNVVTVLRVYLRYQHAQGLLRTPLHQQIAMPQLYRLEQLPRSLPWEQVAALLGSIDRSTPAGLRDFTMLYLAAHYGLRSVEVVRLRLEDVDWRAGTLRIIQTKTRNHLALPLTDESGDVLSRYLREGRPATERREMFLTRVAPIGPLRPSSVGNIMKVRESLSRLELHSTGPHALRHSLAHHLLRQGASMKAIGDTLGHRRPSSTSAYLRLAVDDLRQVGLPVPCGLPAADLLPATWKRHLVKVAIKPAATLRHTGFHSGLAPALRRYFDNRHALGRCDRREEKILRHWDDFMHRSFQRACVVNAPMFHQWAAGLARLNTNNQRMHMGAVRRFLLWYQRRHPQPYLPDPLSFPKTVPDPAPRLVSPTEMARVLATAEGLPPSDFNPLRAQTIRLGLILLFCCGLRLGELLRLRLRHFDARETLLRIEATKFHKSRLVPLSPSVAEELRSYLGLRSCRGLPIDPESHLIWSGRLAPPHDGYCQPGFSEGWQRAALSVGVLDARGRPPCVHHLRHSFAVAALRRWYAAGQDPQSKLPFLSTYLGHAEPAHTYRYLHLTPDLGRAAARRFHDHFGRFLFKGGAA